jgi:hypothetical protein
MSTMLASSNRRLVSKDMVDGLMMADLRFMVELVSTFCCRSQLLSTFLRVSVPEKKSILSPSSSSGLNPKSKKN